MAKNTFRITPRASQVIRAIEDHFQTGIDDACRKTGAPLRRIMFNAGDFVFGPASRIMGLVDVRVSKLELAYTLRDDPEFVLHHQQYEGVVVLQQHRVEKPGDKDFVYYTTEAIEMTKIEEAEEAA